MKNKTDCREEEEEEEEEEVKDLRLSCDRKFNVDGVAREEKYICLEGKLRSLL